MGARFPKLMNSLHADGSVQKAIEISASAAIYKIRGGAALRILQDLLLHGEAPCGASLTLSLDDGAAPVGTSAEIVIPSSSSGRRMEAICPSLRAGGLSGLFAGRREFGRAPRDRRELDLAQSLQQGIPPRHRGSGLGRGGVRLDRRDPPRGVGGVKAALLFQGKTSYADPSVAIKAGKLPLFTGLLASADAQAALSSTPFVSGGGSVESTLLLARLKLKGRATAAGALPSPF